ncbi:MAG: hypothetical protein AB7V22_02450 [Kiritimatiellia bacterium]
MNLRISLLGILGLIALAPSPAAGGRVGGDAEILYERLGPGGAAYATSGVFKLGASLSQNFAPAIATNDAGQTFLNGFWKAEDGCTLYNPFIVDVVHTTNTDAVGITFLVVTGNTYSVEYVDIEPGGLTNGAHVITNEVATLAGMGGAGSTTTVWHDVSGSTNRAKFYLIRCE